MDAFLNSPWFEKLFWLFFAGIIVWIAAIWIRVIVEMIRFERPSPKRGRHAKSAGGGFSESASFGITTYESSSDSGSGSSEIASGDTGGGSDFSGGGGESGGGGASGSWS